MPHILVVDDEADTCMAIAGILMLHGYETSCAANGWEALLQVDKQRYDLILLDIMMPGLDGPKFLNILRSYSMRAATPVVIMTALDEREAMARVNPNETQGIVEKSKGVFYDELVKRVQLVVGPGRQDGIGAN